MSSKPILFRSYSNAALIMLSAAGALCTEPALADISDKLTANIAGGVYQGNGATEYSSAGLGFAGDLGLGYRVADHAAVSLQWRYAQDIASHLGETFEQSFWCRDGTACKADAVNTNSFNLLFQQRPLHLLSYGVGIGWMKENNTLESGSIIANHWQSSASYHLDIYRITLPYELLLNLDPGSNTADHTWSIQAGIKGEACNRICTHGLYVGAQIGL